ncbi:MAG: DMT family transporter [Pseudomonadota bacterium]
MDGRRSGPPVLSYLLLAFAPLTWGGNLIVGRSLADMVDPVTLNLVRWSGAAVLLGLACGPALWRHRVDLVRHWRIIGGLGMTGMCGFHLLQYTALASTTALNVALISAMTPLYVVSMAWVLSGDRLGVSQLLGVLLSIAGAVVIVGKGDLGNVATLQLQRGDLIQVAAIGLWALYCVLLRYRPASIPPLPFLLATILPGLALSLLAYTVEEPRLVWSPAVGWGLAYLILFPSTLAYVAWGAGVRELGPHMAGIFTNLVPIYGALLAVLLLGEQVRPYHVVAAALVAIGIWLAGRGSGGGEALRARRADTS